MKALRSSFKFEHLYMPVEVVKNVVFSCLGVFLPFALLKMIQGFEPGNCVTQILVLCETTDNQD